MTEAANYVTCAHRVTGFGANALLGTFCAVDTYGVADAERDNRAFASARQ